MKATIKALKIIKILTNDLNPKGIAPKKLAQNLWPNSPSWTRSYNVGRNGATSGRGIILSAGSFLHKLCRKDLIYGTTETYLDFKGNLRACGMTTWRLTSYGKNILKWHESLGTLDNLSPEERRQAKKDKLIERVEFLGSIKE
jgi:hypothetical protein